MNSKLTKTFDLLEKAVAFLTLKFDPNQPRDEQGRWGGPGTFAMAPDTGGGTGGGTGEGGTSREGGRFRLSSMLKVKSGVSPKSVKQLKKSLQTIQGNLSPTAASRLKISMEKGGGIVLHKNVAALGKDISKDVGPGWHVRGVWSKGTNTMHLTSGYGDAHDVAAHEIAHAIDEGPPEEMRPGIFRVQYLSDSKSWVSAWKSEIDKTTAEGYSPLTFYARNDPSEGFAEFGRLVMLYDAEETKRDFPKCWKVWEKAGLTK